MPPKFKFTRTQIIESALDIVRKGGWQALTTRSLADKLGASARPIYSYFNSMDELEVEISKRGVDLLYEYMIQKRTDDPWHDHGIGYVLFAWHEKCLFRSLNDEHHLPYYKKYGEVIWNTLTQSLAEYPPFQGLSEEQIYFVQLTRWLLAHGLAYQVSNPAQALWDDETIVSTIQKGSTAILQGLRLQYSSTDG